VELTADKQTNTNLIKSVAAEGSLVHGFVLLSEKLGILDQTQSPHLKTEMWPTV
jgi:hypothetical protein